MENKLHTIDASAQLDSKILSNEAPETINKQEKKVTYLFYRCLASK